MHIWITSFPETHKAMSSKFHEKKDIQTYFGKDRFERHVSHL